MPRRREIPKRAILPDPKYLSVDVAKFVNVLMKGGKKSVAESIIYGALEQIKKKTSKDPLEVCAWFILIASTMFGARLPVIRSAAGRNSRRTASLIQRRFSTAASSKP